MKITIVCDGPTKGDIGFVLEAIGDALRRNLILREKERYQYPNGDVMAEIILEDKDRG